MLKSPMFLVARASVILLAGSLTAAIPAAAQQSIQEEEALAARFEMLYEELAPEQKALVDEWIERYDQVFSKNLEPRVYNELPLSTKTTFAAVTNALMNTALTDKEGHPLLSDEGEPLIAMGLVAKLDTIKGKEKGAPGDEQFRLYVQLIPNAVSLLEECREFSRGRDNTVFHKGYPQSFRSGNGVPSIQFSISLDGRVADIDVDYRSSKFPAALVNGHLTAGNSDVRAGDNYARHTRVWQGLQNWWNGWEGLGDWFAALFGVRGLDIPEETRKGEGSAEDAVHDFLQSWLVEQRPDVAMSYLSEDVYKCFGEEPDSADSNASVEQRMYRKMSETNRVIGSPRNLDGVVQGVFLADLGLPTLRDNPYHKEFVLYPLPPDRVAEFECGTRNMSFLRAHGVELRRSGDYLLGTLYLRLGDLRGATAALLWSREAEGWKLVSFELEPSTGEVPDLHSPPVVPTARGEADMKVDPEIIRANDGLMNAWFVEKDYERALGYVSSDSYPCLENLSEPGEDASRDPRTRFSDALKAVSDFLGDVGQDTLSEAIVRVEPWSPSFRDVTPDESASTLIAIPDPEAKSYLCGDGPNEGGQPGTLGEMVYGHYYGSAFRLKLASGEQPATFLVVWGRDTGSWKVVAFDVVAP